MSEPEIRDFPIIRDIDTGEIISFNEIENRVQATSNPLNILIDEVSNNNNNNNNNDNDDDNDDVTDGLDPLAKGLVEEINNATRKSLSARMRGFCVPRNESFSLVPASSPSRSPLAPFDSW